MAVAASFSYAETLRRLDLCATGGNWLTLQRWAERWGISTEHFDRNASSTALMRARARPLAEILVEGSPYSRSSLKRRLWAEGLKPRTCELCGQGELWRGRPLGLILDHVNGVRDDIGWRTSGSSAQTAPPRSTRTVAARTGAR